MEVYVLIGNNYKELEDISTTLSESDMLGVYYTIADAENAREEYDRNNKSYDEYHIIRKVIGAIAA